MEVVISASHRVWLLTIMGLVLLTVVSGSQTGLCNGIRCGHGSRCNKASCVCKNGFVKSTISHSATPPLIYCHESCNANKNCPANTTCDGRRNNDGTYSCICSTGYTRSTTGHCLANNDQCSSAPCGYNAVCADIPDSFTCTCKAGFHQPPSKETPAICTAIDNCESKPGICGNHSRCTMDRGQVICQCQDGNRTGPPGENGCIPVSSSTTVVSTPSTHKSSTTTPIVPSTTKQSSKPITPPAHTTSMHKPEGSTGTLSKPETSEKTSPGSPLGQTTTSSEKRMDQKDGASQTLVIALAGGISGGVVFIAIVVIILITRRCHHNKQSVDQNKGSEVTEESNRISSNNSEANNTSSEVTEEASANHINYNNSEADHSTTPTNTKVTPLVVIRTEVSVFDGRSSIEDDTKDELKNSEPIEYSVPHKPPKKPQKILDKDSLHSNDNIPHSTAVQKQQDVVKMPSPRSKAYHYDNLYSVGVKSANQNPENILIGQDGSGNPVLSSDSEYVNTSRTSQDPNAHTNSDADILYDKLHLPKV